jgi:uncharacterized membrane protein HdeD (DUF308 family)
MAEAMGTDPAELVREVGRKWWLLFIFAVITIGFGVVLTFKPSSSVHTIAVIIGIWLLIVGLFRLIQAIATPGERLGYLAMGLLSILIAILLMHHTTTTVAVLGFIIGIFWTIGGVAQLFAGFADGRWLVILGGVVSTAIGILCLVYPSLSLSIICVIVGLGLIVYGLVELMVSFEVRRLGQQAATTA